MENADRLRLLVSVRRELAVYKRAFRTTQVQNRMLRCKLAAAQRENFVLKRQNMELASAIEVANTVTFLDTSGELDLEM